MITYIVKNSFDLLSKINRKKILLLNLIAKCRLD